MGALDDAIRQHLELKRAHGAAEDEVQRQEQEALGPARREPLPEPEPEPQAEEELEPVEERAAKPVAEAEAEPAVEAGPTGDTPTRGFDALEEASEGEAPPEEGEDVLEETPEFLQETPEHDRLWFEQKPPRDFDFDQ